MEVYKCLKIVASWVPKDLYIQLLQLVWQYFYLGCHFPVVFSGKHWPDLVFCNMFVNLDWHLGTLTSFSFNKTVVFGTHPFAKTESTVVCICYYITTNSLSKTASVALIKVMNWDKYAGISLKKSWVEKKIAKVHLFTRGMLISPCFFTALSRIKWKPMLLQQFETF